ncbi:MAG: hypothetical protein MOGMAGMI_00910 [Candidatus Omnitrophica bacterium]|nr:hypothetical protein [Candidatus Omnitrophota bacterium]
MKRRGLSMMVLVLALSLSGARVCYAEDAFTKLGRGVANTFTGWVELPKSVYTKSNEQNAVSGATVGLAEGVGMAIVRTGAGIFDVITFPFPVPEDYKPVLEPEYVF